MARYHRTPYTKLFIAALIAATFALIIVDRGRFVAPRARLLASHLFRPAQSGVQAIPMRLSGGGMQPTAGGGSTSGAGEFGAAGAAEIRQYEAALAQQADEIYRLRRQLMDVARIRGELPQARLRIIPTSVLSHDYLAPGKSMTVDRGKSHGLKERQWVTDGGNFILGGRRSGIVGQSAVIDSMGLIGIVSQVDGGVSKVKPITSRDVVLPARVVHWNAEAEQWIAVDSVGTVSGVGDGKLLKLENMQADLDIRPGDYVVTASREAGIGLAENLIIGRVIHVSRAPAEMLHTILVEPRSKFSELDRVYVLAPEAAR